MNVPGEAIDDSDVISAGEYALGLMSEEEARQFAHRLTQDPGLRDIYADWCEDFAPLSDAVPESMPPAKLRLDLEAKIFGGEEPIWQRGLRELLWLVTGAVAASLLAYWFYAGNASDPTHRADLVAEDQSMAVAFLWEAESGQLSTMRRRGTQAPGRDWEVWLIMDGRLPVSLGLLTRGAEGVINIGPEHAIFMTNGTLAISDEPLGGSPSGRPTGPVLAMSDLRGI